MSIRVNRVNTSVSLKKPKPPLCHTCGTRSDAVLTIDANGKSVCFNCDGRRNDPIRQPKSLRGQVD
jgi:formylmethanofuran dehydrogenase subunit E